MYSEKLRKYNEEYRKTHKVEIASQRKVYRQNNKEKIAECRKAYRQSHKLEIAAYRKKYYETHKLEIAEYQQKNREKIAAYCKTYQKKNKQKMKEYRKTWRTNNPDKIKQYWQNYYLKAKAKIGPRHCECGTELLPKRRICAECLYKHNHTGQKPRHGGSYTSIYRIFHHIKQRCLNPNNDAYKWYGGRGISVCNEWKSSFVAFREFALANGYKEGLSINRIDNDGNYEPSNCEFITRAENSKKENKTRKFLRKK